MVKGIERTVEGTVGVVEGAIGRKIEECLGSLLVGGWRRKY